MKKIPLEKPKVIERMVLGPFASFESAKKKSDSLKLKGLYPIITFPENWELWLPAKYESAKKYNFKNKKIIYKSEVVPFLTNDYIHQKLDGLISINSGKNIRINNINYGKKFFLARDSYGTWSLIQKLSIDKYLQGVLPHEIGANSPLEALKAQAIISRTWAFYNADRFQNDKYHLCITTQCQVYKPYLNPNQNINEAITTTSGSILVYKDKPINAFYHATNGGIMSSAGESWEIEEYPYFEAKFDLIKYDEGFNLISFKDQIQVESFLQNNKIDFLGKSHYLFRWKRQISSETIKSYLREYKMLGAKNKITDIDIFERGPSGRVIKLGIYTKNNSFPIILRKDDIRRYLRFLPSNLFIIDKLNDNLWIFKGGGFGHGVGLSQAGAIEMAKLGFNFERILSHYYAKTKIKKIKDLPE